MASSLPRAAHAASENMRKVPRQERAERTVDAIFDATAQIVDTDGEAALTTNKVAARAGFSIGTLYQYFPSKEAILQAIIHRERRRVVEQLNAALERAVQKGEHPLEGIRERIHILVEALGSGSRFRRYMVRLSWQIDHQNHMVQALRESAERMAIVLTRNGHPALRPPSAACLFVATRAVMGAIRSASLEDSPLLGTPAFEDELVRMCWGLLRVD